MTNEITLNGMHKAELLQLLKDTIQSINEIYTAKENILRSENDSEDAKNKILGEEGCLEKTEDALKEAEAKLIKIREAYGEILEDEGENVSIKTELKNLLQRIEEEKKQITNFRQKTLGYSKKNSDGTEEVVKGLSQEINDFYVKQQEKYNSLYNKIETELLAGATTANLAEIFTTKANEFHGEGKKWTTGLIIFFIVIIGYYATVTFKTESLDLMKVLVELLYRLPLLMGVVWFAIFLGNRRAESKKLEESYKHKEVMAKAFMGYKKSIEEIEENNEDKTLIKAHMENLLEVMKEDSGKFLKTGGENHPIFEAFKSNNLK